MTERFEVPTQCARLLIDAYPEQPYLVRVRLCFDLHLAF